MLAVEKKIGTELDHILTLISGQVEIRPPGGRISTALLPPNNFCPILILSQNFDFSIQSRVCGLRLTHLTLQMHTTFHELQPSENEGTKIRT